MVVVLLAVFWAIGGILKARAKKIKAEEEEPHEISETAISRGKARGAPAAAPQPQQRQAGTKALATKIEMRQVEPSKKPAPTPGAIEVAEKPMIEQLLPAEEPDELKKAILHYEILGKPVSLRKPEDGRRMTEDR